TEPTTGEAHARKGICREGTEQHRADSGDESDDQSVHEPGAIRMLRALEQRQITLDAEVAEQRVRRQQRAAGVQRGADDVEQREKRERADDDADDMAPARLAEVLLERTPGLFRYCGFACS